MPGMEQSGQLLGTDVTGQAQGATPLATPPPRRLVGVEVVVDRASVGAVPAQLVGGQPGVVVDQPLQAVLAGLEVVTRITAGVPRDAMHSSVGGPPP